jgi:hypothetical protein
MMVTNGPCSSPSRVSPSSSSSVSRNTEEQLRALVLEVDRIASIPDVLRRETAVSLSDVKVDAAR